jgi:hypothetical protein
MNPLHEIWHMTTDKPSKLCVMEQPIYSKIGCFFFSIANIVYKHPGVILDALLEIYKNPNKKLVIVSAGHIVPYLLSLPHDIRQHGNIQWTGVGLCSQTILHQYGFPVWHHEASGIIHTMDVAQSTFDCIYVWGDEQGKAVGFPNFMPIYSKTPISIKQWELWVLETTNRCLQNKSTIIFKVGSPFLCTTLQTLLAMSPLCIPYTICPTF